MKVSQQQIKNEIDLSDLRREENDLLLILGKVRKKKSIIESKVLAPKLEK